MTVLQHTLEGGFADAVFNAQATFRAIMDGMANPATIVRLQARVTPPKPLTPLAGAVLATLADQDTALWLDDTLDGEAVRTWLAFQAGASFIDAPDAATFAVIADMAAMPLLDRFAQGSQEYPDRSTTIILQLASLDGGDALTFCGPGIRTEAMLAPTELPADFADQWNQNTRLFPRGVDLILVAGDALACLPRSARLTKMES